MTPIADVTVPFPARVWKRDRMFFVVLSNGVEFAIDENKQAVRWTAQPGENIGRRIDRGEVTGTPADLIYTAERTGRSPVKVAV